MCSPLMTKQGISLTSRDLRYLISAPLYAALARLMITLNALPAIMRLNIDTSFLGNACNLAQMGQPFQIISV